MFKLGSYLMFITFSQIIAVSLYLEAEFGINAISHIPFLVSLIVMAELTFSGFLIYKGYPKLNNMD